MLVYGDRGERADPQQKLRAIEKALAAAAREPAGVRRHSALVGEFIEAGRLLQGVADAVFEAGKADRRTEATDALGHYLHALACAVCVSWDSGFAAEPELPPSPDVALPPEVELREPEGFAFYCVYPEAYAEAARRLKLRGVPRFVGLRSIGTSLAAIASAAIGGPPPITLRPHGDPFDRRVSLAPDLAAELLADDAHYVIVDEGPGQSGSSFGCVADWLQAHGVSEERIAFIPSHCGGPGSQASAAQRHRWGRVQKAVANFDRRLPELLAGWVEERLGALDKPLEDISSGRWRGHVYADVSAWPAVNPSWERRKFLGRAGGDTWLVRFGGFGNVGERKLERARTLQSVGWVPEPLGVVHGFLIERWHADARPLAPGEKVLHEIATYLSARAQLLSATPGSGASLEELLATIRRNASLALGDAVMPALAAWPTRLPTLERSVRRIQTDNRLDRHEWLRLPDGRLLKADAIDHCEAHDLIGCQDVAWDVAGAAVELGLDAGALASAVSDQTGRPIDPELLRFFELAYLAFRIGASTLSAEMTSAEPDASRHRAAARHCTRMLASCLLADSTAMAFGGNPISDLKRNEPVREQSILTWVEEDEAPKIPTSPNIS